VAIACHFLTILYVNESVAIACHFYQGQQGQTYVTTVNASTTRPNVTYHFYFSVNNSLSSSSGNFSIDPNTGVITVNGSLNWTLQKSYVVSWQIRWIMSTFAVYNALGIGSNKLFCFCHINVSQQLEIMLQITGDITFWKNYKIYWNFRRTPTNATSFDAIFLCSV